MAVVNADHWQGSSPHLRFVMARTPAPSIHPRVNAFASCGDGNLTVVHEDSPDKFTVVENVPTKRSARTMGLDLKTHNILLPAADSIHLLPANAAAR